MNGSRKVKEYWDVGHISGVISPPNRIENFILAELSRAKPT